jgi:hypothetical protein
MDASFAVEATLGFKPGNINNHVVPAQAGIHPSADHAFEAWVPAFAGMTGMG